MVEVNGSSKHSSLLWYSINDIRKKFYITDSWCYFKLDVWHYHITLVKIKIFRKLFIEAAKCGL